MRNLVARVAGNNFKVPIPAQESPLFIIKIEDARHALDHGGGEKSLILRCLFNLLSTRLVRKIAEGKGDVPGGLNQQSDLFVPKKPRVFRINRERAKDF